MKLIVGLGNPGEEHRRNRHNAGFVFVDRLAVELGDGAGWMEKKKWGGWVNEVADNLLLLKPGKYMNESGVVVQRVIDYFKIELAEVWVVHDDLDLRLGSWKMQRGVGPKVHNGVSSVERSIGKEFWRVRLGVDSRDGDRGVSGEDYVLANFSEGEQELFVKEVGEAVMSLSETIRG